MPDLPERLRVAVFTETFLPKIDGIVSVLQLMLQRLNEQGHQVILFGPEGGPEEFAGAEIVGVGGPKVFFYPELNFNYPRPWIYQRVKQFNPDVIHAVNPFVLGAFGLYCARRLDAPTLASYHTDMARYADHYGFGFTKPALWSYLRSMHNRADVNLCPSSAVRDELRDAGLPSRALVEAAASTPISSPRGRSTWPCATGSATAIPTTFSLSTSAGNRPRRDFSAYAMPFSRRRASGLR